MRAVIFEVTKTLYTIIEGMEILALRHSMSSATKLKYFYQPLEIHWDEYPQGLAI